MLRLQIIPDDGGPYEVTARSRDIAMWERTNKGSKMFHLRELCAEDIYKVALFACRRQSLPGGDLDLQEFRDSRDFEVLPSDEDESVDPTRPAAPAEA